jgi:Tol biopolymer transport system component
MRSVLMALVVPLAACGFSLSTGTSIDASTNDGGGSGSDDAMDAPDASIDAMPDTMMPNGWTAPQSLGISGVDDPTLRGNLLEIWFIQNGDIYHASRGSLFVAFGTATKVDELSSPNVESGPEVSLDGQTITFARLTGNNDLYTSSWDGSSQSWSTPAQITELNTSDHEQSPSMSNDKTLLALTRNTAAGSPDISFATRGSPSAQWGNVTVATELNSSASDNNVFLSANKLTVCFDSHRASVTSDIYCATRSSATQPFDTPAPLTQINSMGNDSDPWLSADGKLLVFFSDRDGTGRLYFSFYDD